MYSSLNHFKSYTTYKLLVVPADENYYTARWCRINRLYAEFFWQAQQAIEKYLKAGLVVNDVPVQGIGHDLSKAFEKHKIAFGDLAFHTFKKPSRLSDRLWRPKSPENFLQKIETQGHPDSRYRLISWSNSPTDLFMLDQLAFALRRLTIGVNWTIGADWKVPSSHKRYVGMKFADVLRSRPQYQPRGRIKTISGPTDIAGGKLEDSFYAWNFPHIRSRGDTDKRAPASVASIMGAASNSQTYLMYERLDPASPTPDPILLDGVLWFINHFHLDKGTKAAFEQRLAEAIRRL